MFWSARQRRGANSAKAKRGRDSFRPRVMELEPRVCLSAAPTIANVSWASSSNTVYVKGDVTATLSDLDALLPAAPITQVNTTTHVWLVGAKIVLQDGAKLELHGTAIGGDVNELRLRSNNTSASNAVASIVADWGTIDIDTIKITSWNEAANAPDTEHATYKRASLRARSKLAADGVTPLESRMDIHNADIGYLGYYAAESYGLSWKVNGTPNASFDLYDKVDVFGDMTNSRVHHCYWGVYTYGGYGMNFLNNEIDNNAGYGLDFHDDSDYFVVEGNNVHDNARGTSSANHGIIFSKRCDHAIVRDNISNRNGGHGIMLHRDSNDAIVEGNTSNDNQDTGIVVFESRNNVIRNNQVNGNKNGIRLSVGSQNNVFETNTVVASKEIGLYFFKGSDEPISTDGRPKNNQFLGNQVRDSLKYAVKLTDADQTTFTGNTFTGGNGTIQLERGVGNRFDGNTFGSNVVIVAKGNSSIPGQTLIVNQPSVKVKIDSSTGTIIFTDPLRAVFQVGSSTTIGTTVTAAGSTLTLNRSLLGSNTLAVTTRPLFATVSSQQAIITPTLWQTTGSIQKQWTTRAAASNLNVDYKVGELIAGQTYTIRKAGAVLTTRIADSTGTITFSDIAGSTSAVQYSVGV